MQELINQITQARRVLLTTHRHCDGDGLGAELAMGFGLRKLGKEVAIVNLDRTPKKYGFLEPDRWIQYYDDEPQLPFNPDLAMVFDTNDQRLIEPLFADLVRRQVPVLFVDHHPILLKGPTPTTGSLIDVRAASTGELTYDILKSLKIPLDVQIARALYTSITFDTQLYRYIRNSPNSHRIAAELLSQNIQTEEIHRALFGNQTVQKMAFLVQALSRIEYFHEAQIAVLRLRDSDLTQFGLEPDESRDVVDMLMNIESLEAAALFREDSSGAYKLSLRTKGTIEVASLAETFGGGGHLHAAGATLRGEYVQLKEQVVRGLRDRLGRRHLRTGS